MPPPSTEKQQDGSFVWNDEYMAKAEALAKRMQTDRHVRFDGAFQARLLIADALLIARAETSALRKALEEIAAIEDQEYGGDWDEIEQARQVARAVLNLPASGGDRIVHHTYAPDNQAMGDCRVCGHSTSLTVEPNTEPLQAWKYEGFLLKAPMWVARSTFLNGRGEAILDRPSGRQVINPGEWLVRSLDGQIEWYRTEAEFRKAFREVR